MTSIVNSIGTLVRKKTTSKEISTYSYLKEISFKDYAFREFPPCPDSFLECQRFVNLTIHFNRARSSLFLRIASFYIMLLVGGRKEENCGWREGGRENRLVFNNRENVFPYFIYVVIISIRMIRMFLYLYSFILSWKI